MHRASSNDTIIDAREPEILDVSQIARFLEKIYARAHSFGILATFFYNVPVDILWEIQVGIYLSEK